MGTRMKSDPKVDQNDNSGRTFFAAYGGSSMNPTLQEPEILEVVPYGKSPVQVGDIVFFHSPETHQPIVHRIVRLTPAGIFTQGDHNPQEDAFLLQARDIRGRVTAAWRGSKRRAIAGGWPGRLIRCWLPWRGRLDRGGSYLLHPIYQALVHRGFLASFVPFGLRPRVVAFQIHGQSRSCLLLGRRIVGRYDDRRQKWHIHRPFRLMVDEQKFSKANFED
jgi:hypothetical protein